MKIENEVSRNISNVTINSFKFNGKLHRSWQAELIKNEDSLLVFVGKFNKQIKHKDLGVIGRGTVSYEFYWLDRYYNVFRFHEPNNDFRNYYCNINLPPTFENGVLNYIDLDVDLLIWKDFTYQISDLDEFEKNAKRFSYSQKLIQKVQNSLDELVCLVESKSFPFNDKF